MKRGNSIFSLPVFLIAREEHRDAAIARIVASGWRDVTWIPAVLGEHAWGCAQSHACAAQRAMERGTYPFLILEEDAWPSRWFAEIPIPNEGVDAFRLDASQWGWDPRYGSLTCAQWVEIASPPWVLLRNMLATAAVGINHRAFAETYIATAHRACATGQPIDVLLCGVMVTHTILGLRFPILYQGPHGTNQNAGITEVELPGNALNAEGRVLRVNLYGGLGNQLFQYANGLSLSRRFGMRLHLSLADQSAFSTPREFALDSFGIRLTPEDELAATTSVIRDEGGYRQGMEQEIRGRVAAFQGPGALLIEGYFQNERFFADIASLLRRQLALNLPGTAGARTVVGIHVRRGDFIGDPLHELCTVGYYRAGIAAMRHVLAGPAFIVVSDDPQWCISTFAGIPGLCVHAGGSSADDFALLRQCGAFIISNSTFSWWAAWLSGSHLVVRPRSFLADLPWEPGPDAWCRIPEGGMPEAEVLALADSVFGVESCPGLAREEPAVDWHKAWVEDGAEALRYDYPLRPDSLVVDLGAYYGTFAAEFARRYHSRVVGFEPIPEFFAQAVCATSAYPEVALHRIALIGGETGEQKIMVCGDATGFGREGGTPLIVRCENVCDFLFDRLGLPLIDLLKINVEGAEFGILQSLIERGFVCRVTHIQVQFHRVVDDADSLRRAISEALNRTHFRSWCYPFVWESWELRQGEKCPGDRQNVSV